MAALPTGIPFGPDDAAWSTGLDRLRTAGATRVSAPSADPRETYPQLPELPPGRFQLPARGLDATEYAQAEDLFRRYVEDHSSRSLGYQLHWSEDFARRLAPYLGLQLNNIGDPYQHGAFMPNSKVLERAVLDYFASLWNAKWPHRAGDPESYWGYVLTMGASEGNIQALWNARECLSGKPLAGQPRLPADTAHENPNARHPVVFFSRETHYSLTKAVNLLGLDTFHALGSSRYPDANPLGPGTEWPTEVPCVGGVDGPGAIDVEKLSLLVRFFVRRGHPVFVNLNYGSTFKGAFDDVPEAARAVHEICAEYGMAERTFPSDREGTGARPRPGYWIHVDAALGAAYVPYLRMARAAGLVESAPPPFDFRLPQVHSLTVSAHKWMGAPWPCGVFMTRNGLRMPPPRSSEYIGGTDTTLSGSRNGFSALLMWDYLAHHSYDDLARQAAECDRLARLAHERLLKLQSGLGVDLLVSRSPWSLAVRFRRPDEAILRRYSLAYETLLVDGVERPYAHLYVVPHVTEGLIDALLRDLGQPGAFAGGAAA